MTSRPRPWKPWPPPNRARRVSWLKGNARRASGRLRSGYPPPDFRKLRAAAIANIESEIHQTEEFIVFLAGRIKAWRFAPEKLLAKRGGIAELTGKTWFEDPKVYDLMVKMPAPQGQAGSFLDWANRFPRTLMWTSMRGSRNPSYYRAVRNEFNKQPMAIAAGLAVEPSAKKVDVNSLPPEEAARHEAKVAKAAEQTEKENKVKAVIAALLGDAAFSEYLASKHGSVREFDHGDVKLGYANRAQAARPGEPTLLDHYRERVKRAEANDRHTDRMYSLKRLATDLKDIARRVGVKVKLPK